MPRPNIILPTSYTVAPFGGPKASGAHIPGVPRINKPKGAPPTASGYAYSRNLAQQAAQTAGIDPQLFIRQLSYVSALNPTARKKGWGIAGLTPFDDIKNVNPWNPQQSVDYAAKVMAGLQLLKNTYG